MTGPPIRLLVDHCTVIHGDTVRVVSMAEPIMWGPKRVVLPVAQLQGRSRDPCADWLRREIDALPAVTAAARAGRIEPFTSLELEAEAMLSRRPCMGTVGDLWAGVSFGDAPAPLDRSRWMGALTLSAFCSRARQREFYELLLHFAQRGVPRELMDVLNPTPFEMESIARLGEFARICEAVGETRRGDAFHFWTAVRNGLDYFLTTDQRFLAAIRQSSVEWAWQAVSPSEVAECLELPPRRLPVSEGEVVPYL